MPKPLAGENGSGMHTYQSLFKGDQNAFFDAADAYNLSPIAKSYMAGLLRHAPELTLVTNQWINSYKRLVPGYEAPVYLTWARRNRSDLIRVPHYRPGKEASTRIEYRAPDAACNPYLAFAVMLAAGLEGIEREYPLAPATEENAFELGAEERKRRGIEMLPGSLKEAIQLFESSDFARRALGDHVFESLLENKTIERSPLAPPNTHGAGVRPRRPHLSSRATDHDQYHARSMKPQPLTWDDIPRVHELLARRWAVDDPRAQMHIGDFYWALRVMPNGDPLSDTRIWPRPDGSLAAFAWLDPPEFGDVIVDPTAHPSMSDEALDWLEGGFREQGRTSISVILAGGDAPRTRALARRGYAPVAGGNTRLRQQIMSEPGAAPLPAGYALRHVATTSDMARRAFVETDAFPVDGRVVAADAWRLLTQRLPSYRPELDLIAVAPDGTGASACTCWYDEATRCGEFEAVGTAQAHRRRGAGKAVITEGLRCLHKLGATAAVVFTQSTNDAAIALYQSCGFEVVGEDQAWIKRL